MFSYAKWRTLPMHVRNDIAVQFGIPKSGTTHVDSNQIVSDGYKVEDIDAKLTPEAIQEYVGVENSDMEIVWDMMVDKIQGNEPVEPTVSPEEQVEEIAIPASEPELDAPSREEIIPEAPKKPGRKPKAV